MNKTMKKNILCILSLSLLGLPLLAQPSRKEIKAAYKTVERVAPQMAGKLHFEALPKQAGCDVFEQQTGPNGLTIKGSSGVALCRGFYDFVRENGCGIVSWTGSRITPPANMEACTTREVVSPVPHHYYFNVVTYGYTLPYWDWARWEREIDWMALHGVDMPLALVANEAITERVWKKLGLTDEEISSYFVGPAHLPWMRMGNISGVDSPLPKEWHQCQIALQHKILKRMKELGMSPICPAFAGFVPKAIKRLYPNVTLTETEWAGFHNWMLSPEDELFHTIGKMFIEEWEKEFGENKYYIADSFNEMEIPFPPKGQPERYSLLASYGDKVYRSIRDGNPKAVWVMQGWMFGYQRDIWGYETLQALVSKVPDDKMLLLDLAVDYSECIWKNGANWDFYKGFYNKPWVYSVIPNMGGKSGMTGILPFYANGQLKALNSPNRGRLDAIGMAPEGFENNEVVYELFTQAAWSDKEIDVNRWLENYSRCRYGSYPAELASFWSEMQQSVYGSFTDSPRFNWQSRPGRSRKGGFNDNEHFYKGIEQLCPLALKMKGNALFEADFEEWASQYAGARAQAVTAIIEKAYTDKDTARATLYEGRFVKLLQGIDALLAGHPAYDMQHWIDFARNQGAGDKALADKYEANARRIVTIWGPPVDDYSARIWSGLIRDYYLPRWQHYFAQKKSGTPFDFATWERGWVEQTKGLSAPTPVADKMAYAVQLIQEAQEAIK